MNRLAVKSNTSTFKEDQILRNSFSTYYRQLAILHESKNGVSRYFSGITMPYLNAVMGFPNVICQWDDCIEKELEFFQSVNKPFVWYVDETVSQTFKEKLMARGFVNQGVLRGVIGSLDKLIPEPEVPEGYFTERVQDQKTMAEFNELFCLIFGVVEQDKSRHKSFLWESTQTTPPLSQHWIVRKNNRVVSILTTFLNDGLVSFWNGATLPEERRKGLSTALRHLALKEALAFGFTQGASYLRSEGMAFGICSKLGFQTRWRFEAFLSP